MGLLLLVVLRANKLEEKIMGWKGKLTLSTLIFVRGWKLSMTVDLS